MHLNHVRGRKGKGGKKIQVSYYKLLDHYLSFMHLGAFSSYAENTRRRDVRVARAASEGMHEKRMRSSTISSMARWPLAASAAGGALDAGLVP